MPQVPGPGQTKQVVRWFYCLICGAMYFILPPDRICLMCKKQGNFKQVDLTVSSATETLPT